MTEHRRLFVSIIVLALLVFTVPTFAQRGDRDGDGVPDDVDSCPAVPGPRENGGCPLPDSGSGDNPPDGSNDRDGDGVADFVDGCPDQPGTGFTNGCPVEETQPEAPNPQPQPFIPQFEMVWQDTSICRVGVPPSNGYSINVREEPTTSSPILGQLAPGQQFAPYFVDYDANGAVWYGGAPVGDTWGWVAGFVMIDNGQCASLPMIIHVDAPFQPEIELLLLDSVPITTIGTLIGAAIGSYANDDDEDAAAPDGGTMSVDDWDTHESRLLLDLLGDSNVPPNPALIFKFHDYLVSSYQTGIPDGTSNTGEEPPSQYQNTFFAIPAILDGDQLQPLLLFKAVDPNTPDENCADMGEGFCVLSVLLLPSFGDAPGQCPPGQFDDEMQASFGDGDTDGRDFLIWQRNLGADAADNVPKLGEYAINGNSLGLLLPAVQAAREAAGRSSAPLLDLELNFAGDGSVMPADGEMIEEEISFVYQSIKFSYSCAVVAGVPDVGGSFTWMLLLPAVQGG